MHSTHWKTDKRQQSADDSHSSSLVVTRCQSKKARDVNEDANYVSFCHRWMMHVSSSSAKGVVGFFFPDREALQEAVNLWCGQSTREQAEAQYGNISTWNTSEVTDMNELFLYKHEFNDDISSWDVSNFTDMSRMFEYVYSFNQPIGCWDVSHVTNLTSMFQIAFSFNQPIGSWNVSSVQDMNGMFFHALAFNQPIGLWNVSSVSDMSFMFLNAQSFNQSVGQWDVGNVEDMCYMFELASSFNQPIGNWDTSRVRDMTCMFKGAKAFNQFIGDWDTGKVRYCRDLMLLGTAGSPSQMGVDQWNLQQNMIDEGLNASDDEGYVNNIRDYLAFGSSKYQSKYV